MTDKDGDRCRTSSKFVLLDEGLNEGLEAHGNFSFSLTESQEKGWVSIGNNSKVAMQAPFGVPEPTRSPHAGDAVVTTPSDPKGLAGR